MLMNRRCFKLSGLETLHDINIENPNNVINICSVNINKIKIAAFKNTTSLFLCVCPDQMKNWCECREMATIGTYYINVIYQDVAFHVVIAFQMTLTGFLDLITGTACLLLP